MIYIIYILALLGALSIVFLGYDLLRNLNVWQCRIHTGRYADSESWVTQAKLRAKKWTRRMPVVPVSENNRLILLDILRKRHANMTVQGWQRAALIMALGDDGLYNSPDITDFVRDGHCDAALYAYALGAYTSVSPHSIRAKMDAVYSMILQTKGDCETVPYRRGTEDIRFVDTTGLICPFLAFYGITYSIHEAVELARKQLEEYAMVTGNTTSGLPPHAFRVTDRTPLGAPDWGRGTGWYIIGLVETRRAIAPGPFHEWLSQNILTLAEYILRFQTSEGGWRPFLASPGMNYEGSATATCMLLMTEAFLISHDMRFKNAYDRALNDIMAHTQRNGALDICQGDTHGISNYSSRYGYMPFAQGMALLAKKRMDGYAHT